MLRIKLATAAAFLACTSAQAMKAEDYYPSCDTARKAFIDNFERLVRKDSLITMTLPSLNNTERTWEVLNAQFRPEESLPSLLPLPAEDPRRDELTSVLTHNRMRIIPGLDTQQNPWCLVQFEKPGSSMDVFSVLLWVPTHTQGALKESKSK